MKKYEEFANCKIIEDKKNPFCTLFENEDGSRFYIEPIFYTYLENFKNQHSSRFDEVLQEMNRIVRKNKKVIFSGIDEETELEPVTKAEGYIVLTLFDITDRLCIFWDNNSRGSDYGD